MPETQRNSSSPTYGPCMCNGNSPRRAAVLLLTLVDIEMYPLEADTVRLSAVVCLCSVLLCVPCVCVCECVLEKESKHWSSQLHVPCWRASNFALLQSSERVIEVEVINVNAKAEADIDRSSRAAAAAKVSNRSTTMAAATSTATAAAWANSDSVSASALWFMLVKCIRDRSKQTAENQWERD